MYHQLSGMNRMIVLLSTFGLVTALNTNVNFTELCEEVRLIYLDEGTYNGTYNLHQLVCGKTYSEDSLPALQISTNLTYCMARAAGYETSKTLAQWADPMFMFLVPAFAFTIPIPRKVIFKSTHDRLISKLSPTKPVRYLALKKVFDAVWHCLVLLSIGILACLENLLWGVVIFTLSGPLIATSLHEIAIDHFILVQVQRNIFTNPDTTGFQTNVHALAFMLIGSFNFDKNMVKAIKDGLKAQPRKKRAEKLLQLFYLIPSFDDVIVGPVIFYLGIFVWTLYGAKERIGDNDLAHGTAFGIWYGVIVIAAITCSATMGINKVKRIEGIFPPDNDESQEKNQSESLDKSEWIWFKHRRFQQWIERYDTQQLSNYPKGAAKRNLTWIALFGAVVFVIVPCSLAISICYWTPTVGFGCRSVTVMVYLAAQLMLIIAWHIDVMRIDNLSSTSNGKSVPPILSRSNLLLVSTALLPAILSVVGGTIMQLAGVYRNCICIAGLKYAFNYNGGRVDLATDTQQNRDNWSSWWRNGVAALSFFALILIAAAMHETWMKERFKYVVDMMRHSPDEDKDKQELTSPLVHHGSGLEE